MVEFFFMLVFLMVIAWALFLTNNLARVRKRMRDAEAELDALRMKYNVVAKNYNEAFEAGKQFAYNDMAKEIKNTIKKAKDDDS